MSEKKDITRKLLIGLCIVGAIVLAYFALPKLIVIFLPFLIAYIISLIASPIVQFLSSKLKFPKKLAAGLCTLIVVAAIAFLIYSIAFRLVLYIQSLISDWENIKAYWTNIINIAYEKMNIFYHNSSPEFQGYLDIALEACLNEIQELFSPLVNGAIGFATNFAMGIPSAIIFTIVMFLATYFILGESDILENVAKSIIGEKNLLKIQSLYKDMMRALIGYIKAQTTIMAIVSIPLMIGLYIVGIKSFVLIAILIAIFDALPIFGSGAILIPWSLFGLIVGDYKMAIVMIILYFIIIITRQMLEPKIVGKHIGVPPIFTLISMYAGLKLFGIFGMVLGPICVLILKKLYVSGVIGIKKRKNETATENINNDNLSNESKKGETNG